MDLTMAGMDGLETCRRLRSLTGPNRETPVLAVTGHAEARHREACLAAGMNGWVVKPVEAADLYEAIELALVGREGAAAAA
jgi:CheY-like chemotaxis protein